MHLAPCGVRRLVTALVLLAVAPAVPHAQQGPDAIRLNQVGFYPDGPKLALVLDGLGDTYTVETPGGDVVHSGTLGAPQTWPRAGETVRHADFSGVTAPGTYVVVLADGTRSHPFGIRARVHQPVAEAAWKMFYYARASAALAEADAGRWHRPAGHPDDAVLVHASAAGPGRPTGTSVASPGGWYDAGDYNKYVVNSGISTYTLLAFYEHYPAYAAAFDLAIPESGDALPDVLDQSLWNVRWLLTMQDPADGGVYHKLTTAHFEGSVMPHAATATRYVVQKSTAAALDFAAVAAQGARIFAAYETELPGLADSLRTAALDAWVWARRHPTATYNQDALNAAFAPDIHTGAYGDTQLNDEFRWAAMELFATTRADSFLTVVGDPIQPVATPSWSSVQMLGLYTLAHHQDALPASDAQRVRDAIRAQADAIASRTETSAFRVPIDVFWWGSNSFVANDGVLLLRAYALTGDERYLRAAEACLDYLLGRNATAYSFVTGYGGRTPRDPHHRPSEADGVDAPVPGLLVGGPNGSPIDGCSYPHHEPARRYVDARCSYTTNEITINWNAPLAYLAAAIEAHRAPDGRPGPRQLHLTLEDQHLSQAGGGVSVDVAEALAEAGPFTVSVVAVERPDVLQVSQASTGGHGGNVLTVEALDPSFSGDAGRVYVDVTDGARTSTGSFAVEVDRVLRPPAQAYVLAFGGDDVAQAPRPEAFDLGNAWTLEGWVRLDQSGPYTVLFGKGLDDTGTDPWRGMSVGLDGDGVTPLLELSTGAPGTLRSARASAPLTVGRWTHLAGTRAADGTLRLYVDGELAGTGAAAGTFAGPTLPFALGGVVRSDGSLSNTVRASLREVRVWDRARTQAEIGAGAQAAAAGDEPGLVAAWPLGEGAGQAASEVGPSGHHLVLGTSGGTDPADPTWEATHPVSRGDGARAEGLSVTAFPNPFRTTATLRYTVPSPGSVRLTVHDVLGRTVSTVVAGAHLAGTFSVDWAPRGLPSGLYLCRLQVDGRSTSRALVRVD